MRRYPQAVDYGQHRDETSLFTSRYTYSQGKLSCHVDIFPVHQALAYVVFFAGIGCFITRALPPRGKRLHAWFGRLYIIAMLWCTGTALLINNTGTPGGVLVSFVASLSALTLGWIVIIVHKDRHAARVEALIVKGMAPADARRHLSTEEGWRARALSAKTLHGVLFFVSWFNIAGRVFVTPWTAHTCYTYPVYKPIALPEFAQGATANLTLVPVLNAGRVGPWEAVGGNVQWGFIVTVGAGAFAFLVLLVAAVVGARRDASVSKLHELDAEQAQDDSMSSNSQEQAVPNNL